MPTSVSYAAAGNFTVQTGRTQVREVCDKKRDTQSVSIELNFMCGEGTVAGEKEMRTGASDWIEPVIVRNEGT